MTRKNSLLNLIKKFIGYDCEVVMADYFFYNPTDEVIAITLFEDNTANTEWKKYLKETFNFNLTRENLFAMSILHELGHHYTVDLFDDDEWTEQATEVRLNGLTGSERYQAYYNQPIEKVATAWAVEIYNNNEKIMRAWSHRLNCALRHYEKKKHVKSSLTCF